MNKILIVEDEKAISDLIKIELETQGYKCECVEDGEIAANYIEEKNYDLILLDIMLPKIDGNELLEYIKETKNTRGKRDIDNFNLDLYPIIPYKQGL